MDNLVWLRRNTHAYLHADLIAGLPGEDLASFADSFDRLAALDPHEIQVGVLKRLRGAPLDRHTTSFDCRYNPHPLITCCARPPWILRRCDGWSALPVTGI